MLRTTIQLTCLIALLPVACQRSVDDTGESTWAMPSGKPSQPGTLIEPPRVGVPDLGTPPVTYKCTDGSAITLPAGVTEDDVKTWQKDHSHLVDDQAGFDALCMTLRAGLADIIKQSQYGTAHAADPTLAWLASKARSAAVVTIATPPSTGSGSPAIIGTTTDTLEAEFACGKQGSRNVLCASSAPPPAGDWVVVSTILTGPLALDDTSLSHQYAFVFDEDGDPSNDYLAPAAYPYDFFDGTDRWYQIAITAGGAPSLIVQSAKNGNVQPYASNARVVLEDNLVMALIPLSEFAVPCPEYRTTTFAHHGDYGLNPPYFWGGDTEPTIDDGLYGVCES